VLLLLQPLLLPLQACMKSMLQLLAAQLPPLPGFLLLLLRLSQLVDSCMRLWLWRS
jgi:hypothetical protein